MTTKTDITLPPLPMPIRGSAFVRGHAPDDDRLREWGRAAVEADRQDRMPSDDDEALPPLAHDDRAVFPASIVRKMWELKEHYRRLAGHPASCDCSDKSQCWEPCGDLGHDAEHAKLSSGQPGASAEPTESVVLLDALSGLVKALRERHYGRMPDEVQAAYDKAWAIVFSSPVAAPVAQEPVLVGWTVGVDGGGILHAAKYTEDEAKRAGYPLAVYRLARPKSAPAAAQAQPVVTNEMVSRFLVWKLPEDFAPDCGIIYTRSPHVGMEPTGTNLLTAIQAKQMLEYVLSGASQAQPIMPPLTDSMRAVLRNEHCVYDSEDALYAALCDAAPAQRNRLSVDQLRKEILGSGMSWEQYRTELKSQIQDDMLRQRFVEDRIGAQPSAQDREDAAYQRDVAIGMLAHWVVAIEKNGTGWDDWDEHFKNARFRDTPIRKLLDEAIDAARAAQGE